jgi:GAF domain-containing protein
MSRQIRETVTGPTGEPATSKPRPLTAAERQAMVEQLRETVRQALEQAQAAKRRQELLEALRTASAEEFETAAFRAFARGPAMQAWRRAITG